MHNGVQALLAAADDHDWDNFWLVMVIGHALGASLYHSSHIG